MFPVRKLGVYFDHLLELHLVSHGELDGQFSD